MTTGRKEIINPGDNFEDFKITPGGIFGLYVGDEFLNVYDELTASAYHSPVPFIMGFFGLGGIKRHRNPLDKTFQKVEFGDRLYFIDTTKGVYTLRPPKMIARNSIRFPEPAERWKLEACFPFRHAYSGEKTFFEALRRKKDLGFDIYADLLQRELDRSRILERLTGR